MKYIKKYRIIIAIVFFFSMFIKPAFCPFIIGSLVFYLGITAILFLNKIQKKGIECTGIILSFESDRRGYKIPVVEFTPNGGELIAEKPYTYVSTDISKIRSYDNLIGNQVSVLYDPDDPKKFILTNENEFSYAALIFLILVALAFITISICSFLGYIKIG